MIKEITKSRFDALCYVRNHNYLINWEEVKWFEIGQLDKIAVINQNLIDIDYGFLILKRDSNAVFEMEIISESFYETIELAETELKKCIETTFLAKSKELQNESVKQKSFLLFKEVISRNKQHPYFISLNNESFHEPAKKIITEIAYSFKDIDGDFIQQFQGHGFNARLWELFLYSYFIESGFSLDRSLNRPDFCLEKYGQKVFVEAVSVNKNSEFDVQNVKTTKEIVDLSKDYLPIKFGSPLRSKLEKKYWEDAHVQGNPLIFAIHDYHIDSDILNPGSMTWSRAGLANYLYGQRDEVDFDENGYVKSKIDKKDTIKMTKTDFHSFNGKTIPSYFFNQPQAENVSAVLFSNGSTIATFNRMGKLAGLDGNNLKIVRNGVEFNKDGIIPFTFIMDDEEYSERWAETIVLYHNPNANLPISPELFPDILHITYNTLTNEFLYIFPQKHIFMSHSIVIKKV
jgi:hypothetical protein